MCGITGIFDTRSARPVVHTVLHRMNESQHHRGPDEGSLHIEPGLGLGHRRLSIIDVATGQQPLFNEDRSVVVVFNGEIYNYQDLIPELQALGHVFHTKSDTECIVHAWESWGEDCVKRFRGMFAFALWDRNKQTFFLARDRLGVKPMYYAVLDDGTLLFGSELKSLLAHGGLRRDMDPMAVEEYFALGYVPEPRTIFKQAKKLPPAHTLCIRRGQPVPAAREYWDVRFTLDSQIDEIEAQRELIRRLDESVRLRMIAEVPLGAFLSGGVDSSAVVAAMARQSKSPVNTCSIGFDDPNFNETEWNLWRKANGCAWPNRPVANRLFNLAHLAYQAAITHQGVAIGRSISVNRLLSMGALVVAVDAGPGTAGTYRLLTNKPSEADSSVGKFAAWWRESMLQTQAQTLAILTATDEPA